MAKKPLSRAPSPSYQARYRRKVLNGSDYKPWKAPRQNWDSNIAKLNASTSGEMTITYRSIGVANTMAIYVKNNFSGIKVRAEHNKVCLSVN